MKIPCESNAEKSPLRCGGSWHGELSGLGERVVEPLEGCEEKRLVAAVVQLAEHDRPAGREAVTLVAGVVLWTAGPLEEEIVGRHRLVAVVVIAVALEPVGAALERDVHGRAGGVALLRVERRRLDFEFLHGAGRRNEGDSSTVGHVGRPVERELVATRTAVGGEVRCAAVIERPRELQIAVVGNAGGEPRQHEGVPVRQRHQGDPLLVDDLPRRAAACVEQRRLGCDEDGLLEVADLQRERQLDTVADSDLNAFPSQFLKPDSSAVILDAPGARYGD